MRGEKVNGEYDGMVAQILGLCGLQAKFMVVTGDPDPTAAEPLGGKVLGLSYELAADKFSFAIPMQFHMKGRPRQKRLVTLTLEEIQRIQHGDRTFSRREALSFVMGVFDPLGYLGPALLPGRLLLRRLYGEGSVGWDQDFPQRKNNYGQNGCFSSQGRLR